MASDTERLDWMIFTGARVCCSRDGEVAWVKWDDGEEDEFETPIMNDAREAIDAAMRGEKRVMASDTPRKPKWMTSAGGLIYVVGGSVVGTVDTVSDGYHAYGHMADWQDTDLGHHSNQLSARNAVTSWVRENE